jgi:hypothetical protein
MKKLISISILLVCFIACSETEPNLELSNPEAFAFDLGDSWEVNASIKAMGFKQLEVDDAYSANLSYFVDIVTPDEDSLKNIFSNEASAKENEEIMDLILEAQIEIDSTFGEGNYKLIFNVTDDLSTQSKSISVAFNLTK